MSKSRWWLSCALFVFFPWPEYGAGQEKKAEPKPLKEFTPPPIQGDAKDDHLRKLQIERHNKIIEALVEFAKRIEGGLCSRQAEELGSFVETHNKLYEHFSILTEDQRIQRLEKGLEFAKSLEKIFLPRKEVDPPEILQIATAHRLDMEIRLEKAKAKMPAK